MQTEFDILKRQALASGDASDWQRLALSSRRTGLDLSGAPLPAQALFKLDSRGLRLRGQPRQLCFSPCGQYLAMSSARELSLWHYGDKACLWSAGFSVGPELTFDCFSRLIYQGVTNRGHSFLRRVVLGPRNQTHRVLDFEQRADCAFSQRQAMFVALTADGVLRRYELSKLDQPRLLCREVPGVQLQLSRDDNRVTWIEDSVKFRRAFIHAFDFESTQVLSSEEIEGGVLAYALGPTSLLVLTYDERLIEFDQQLRPVETILEGADARSLTDLTVDAEGRYLLLSQGYELRCYDLFSRSWAWTQTLSGACKYALRPKFQDLAVATLNSDRLFQFHLGSGQEFECWHWPRLTVRRLCTKNSVLVAVCAKAGWVIYHWASHDIRLSKDGRFLDLAPDGQSILVQFSERVEVHSSQTGEVLQSWPLKGIKEGRWCLDGRIIVSSFQQRWEILNGVVTGPQPHFGEDYGMPEVALSESGRYVFESYYHNGLLLQLWDRQRAELIDYRIRDEPFHIHGFSDHDSVIWTSIQPSYNFSDPVIYEAFRSDDFALVASRPHSNSRVFAACAQRPLVALIEDKVIQLWRVPYDADNPEQEWTLCASFEGHDCDIVALTFAPDGSMLISADKKGHVVFWNSQKFARSDYASQP